MSWIPGVLGGFIATRGGFALSSSKPLQTFARSPIIQGGTFGIGYTGGSYTGYGISNTVDPLKIHQGYKRPQRGNHRLSYYGYGRRRYRRRYGRSRYSRYSGYRRYRRYRSRRYY